MAGESTSSVHCASVQMLNVILSGNCTQRLTLKSLCHSSDFPPSNRSKSLNLNILIITFAHLTTCSYYCSLGFVGIWSHFPGPRYDLGTLPARHAATKSALDLRVNTSSSLEILGVGCPIRPFCATLVTTNMLKAVTGNASSGAIAVQNGSLQWWKQIRSWGNRTDQQV